MVGIFRQYVPPFRRSHTVRHLTPPPPLPTVSGGKDSPPKRNSHPSKTTSASPGCTEPCRAACPSGVTRKTLQPKRRPSACPSRRVCPPPPRPVDSTATASSSSPRDPGSKATKVQATGGGGACWRPPLCVVSAGLSCGGSYPLPLLSRCRLSMTLPPSCRWQ